MSWRPPQLPVLPLTLVQAIARVEGFYATHGADGNPLTSPNRPQRNRNPGNIEFGPFARAHGAVGSDGRFAIFPDDDTGFAALTALLKSEHYTALSIAQAVNRYAPPNENNTAGYVAKVCAWTRRTPDQILSDVFEIC